MTAAVADYKPKYQQDGKLKSHLIGENWNLELIENRDILKSISKEGIFKIGFKAEMDSENGIKYGQEMLKKKELDGVCLNILSDSSSFGTETNQIDFITDKTITQLPRNDKLNLAFEILNRAKQLEKRG